MGLKGKLISEMELKGCKDLFHEMFCEKPHHLPNIVPHTIKAVDLHEGDWGTVGSVVNWNYTIGGEDKVVKVVVDDVNKEKRLVTFKAFEGHLIEEYKSFKATVHIENEGENSLVIWTIEYEKQNESVPEPLHYLQLAINLTKDVDTHHVNKTDIYFPSGCMSCLFRTDESVLNRFVEFAENYQSLRYRYSVIINLFYPGRNNSQTSGTVRGLNSLRTHSELCGLRLLNVFSLVLIFCIAVKIQH